MGLVVILVFLGLIYSSNYFSYEKSWERANNSLTQENWNLAVSLYSDLIFDIEKEALEETLLPSMQQEDLARIRSEFGLALLRKAWLNSSDIVSKDNYLSASRHQLGLSIEAALQLESNQVLAEAYNNLAGWHFVKGDPSEVIENLLIAQRHYESVNDLGASLEISNNLGMMYRKLGELRESQNAFHTGLALSERANDPKAKGALHFNISKLYLSLGDLAQSQHHAEQSLYVHELAGMTQSAMLSRSFLATVQREVGSAQDAFELHQFAANYFEQNGLPHFLANARQEMVADLIQLQRLEDAYEMSHLLLENVSNFDSQADKSLAYARHAQLLIEMESVDTALNFVTRKLEDHSSSKWEPVGRIALINALREGYQAKGDVEQAIAQADKLFAIIEDQRTEFETLRLGPLWSQKNHMYYAKHIEFLLELKIKPGGEQWSSTAFEVIQRASVISLRQRRMEAIRLNHKLTATGIEKWRRLVDQLENLEAASAETSTAEKERQFNLAHESFFVDLGQNASASDLAMLSIEEIQSALDNKQIALLYFAGPLFNWRYLVSKDHWTVSKTVETAMIDSLVEQVRSELSNPVNFGNEATQALSEAIFGNLDWPKEIEQIFFVPAANMHTVPFSALWKGDKRVSEIAPSIVVPSLSEFFTPSVRDELDHQLALAVFADPDFEFTMNNIEHLPTTSEFRSWTSNLSPLPSSAQEAKMLSAIFEGEEIAIFLGREANRINLFSTSVLNSRILHIASHGYFNESEPELVGFALARSNQLDDGFVSIAEIAAQDFGASLVVINACETDRGQPIAGEGVLSLSRTFLAQGVDSVVSTLWPVSDEAAAIFMHEFYAALRNEKLSIAESLRQAQLALRNHPRFSHPFYWGSYKLTSAKPIFESG